MELVQQHRLPDPLQVLVRVRVPRHPDGRGGGPQLGLAQQRFAAPVALLGLGLRGVGAAVQLQVQLARPDGGVLVLGTGLVEERVGRLDLDPRGAFEVPLAPGPGQLLAGGAAAAVAPAEGGQGARTAALLPVVAGGVGQLGAAEIAVVGVDGREVGEDAGAVDALPAEGVVRERVHLRPGDLLRQEPVRAREPDDLRHRGGVAEGVGQPDAPGLDAELVEEELLAVHELPDHGLAADHVGVGLHPHAADRYEPALRDLLLDPLEELGPVDLDPVQLLRLRHGEHELGVPVHQVDHVGGGPGDLADGLAQRPQPGRVDVGVADGADPVRGGVGGRGEDPGEARAGGGRGGGHVGQVHRVEGRVDGAQDPVPAGVSLVELHHQVVEDFEVLDEFPDLGLEDGQVHPGDPVQGPVAAGEPVALGGGPVVDEDGVRGRLDVPLDPLAAGRGVGDAHPVVVRVERLDLAAVGAVDQALALEAGHHPVEAEVEDGLDGAARPVGRDAAGDLEPGGAPGRPPRLADRAGTVRGRQALGDGHGLAGGLPALDGERDGAGVHGGFDALREDAAEAVFGDAAVVVHGGGSRGGRSWDRRADGCSGGGSGLAQVLTAPSPTPLKKKRWRARKRSIIGRSAAIAPAAMIRWSLVVAAPARVFRPS